MPKAYEIVNYKGKATGVTVAFKFADGYPNASEIKITESASGKTTKFQPDGDEHEGKMRFVSVKVDDGTKEVLLEMEAWGEAPATVAGAYTAGGKTVRFTLAKSEED
jgi:hypothetical protein